MPARTSRAARSSSSSRAGKTLPQPPLLIKTLGPSFVLLGIALGSGELILWPYLTATYGLGLLWGGLLGISLQFFLNTETMRYTLARGESVFVGFRKLSIFWPIWFIFSTFIPWSIPGFSSASASLFTTALNLPSEWNRNITILFLILTGLLLSSGKSLYNTMERLQKTVVLTTSAVMLSLALYFTQQNDWVAAGWGLIGRGDGWWFFPPGLALFSFMGAFAYSGAGGNLNLAQSYYIKDKGFGMGAFREKMASLFSNRSQKLQLDGEDFAHTAINRERWNAWWRTVNLEHFIVFWLLGIVTIVMLATFSASLLRGAETGQGISFLTLQASVISQRTFAVIGTFFLLGAMSMLVTTQIGVLEAAARIISENLVLLFRQKEGEKWNLSLLFYIVLWSQIGLGILVLLAGFKEPRLLLTLGAVLNGAAMMIAFPLLLRLNTTLLPTVARPGFIRKAGVSAGFLFFAFFLSILVMEQLGIKL
jgi:hypothetical protein